METQSFALLVAGEEFLAGRLCDACRECLDCAPPFVALLNRQPPAWRILVRLKPCPRPVEWMDVAKGLSQAMSGFGLHLDLPQERDLRARLDRLLAAGAALMRDNPGCQLHMQLPDSRPTPWKKLTSADLAWRLLE